jgi:hypothetical protein
MVMDIDQAAQAMREEGMLAEIEDFIEGLAPAHLARHAGQWGSGRYVVIPRWVVWG